MQKLCCYAFGPPFGQFLFIVKKYCSFLENMIVRIVVNTREESLLEDLRRDRNAKVKYENSKAAKSKEINLGIEGSESEVYTGK